MSIKGQGHSLTLVKGHSDFKVKCLTFCLYTQVSDSGPHGPLVKKCLVKKFTFIFKTGNQEIPCHIYRVYEHCVTSRADPIQPADQGCAVNSNQLTEGYQGSGCDVIRTGGGFHQYDEWESSRSVGSQVLSLP